ncbi:MAG TPA: hypothetical protein VIL18_09670 [Longimicrobiales bacterium]
MQLVAVLPAGERGLLALSEAARPCADLVLLDGWSAVIRCLAGRQAPAALVVAAERADEQGRRVLELLHYRGLLVPTAVFFERADLDLLQAAWPLARLGIEVLVCGADLSARLARLLAAGPALLAGLLAERLRSEQPGARRLLWLLAEQPEMRTAPAVRLATTLGISRSALYEAVAAAGLPPIEHLQFLFRLLPALRILQGGGRVEDAAYAAGLADGRSLRKVLRSRLTLTVEEARRQAGGLAWLVERSLALHGRLEEGGGMAPHVRAPVMDGRTRKGGGRRARFAEGVQEKANGLEQPRLA